MSIGYNEHLKEIETNKLKAKELDILKNQNCVNCKHNRTLCLTSYPPKYINECSLLNRTDMKYCSLWEGCKL